MNNSEILSILKSIAAQTAGLVKLLEQDAEPTPEQEKLALLSKREELKAQISRCRDPMTREALKTDLGSVLSQLMEYED
jgi:hypothetical protein